jgi:hypothetical protein
MHWLIVASMLAASPEPSGTRQGGAREREEKSTPKAAAADEQGAGARPTPEEKKLEEEIAKDLGAQPAAAAPPAQAGPAPAQPAAPQGGQGQTGGNPFARLLLLPDISAIADFAAVYDSLDVGVLSPRGGPYGDAHRVTPLFQELELGLQSVIDPYARADIFISFSPEEVDVEEAYLTTLTLPAGLQVRAGKFLSPFGRLNQMHPHVWDFVDAPLAMDRLLSVDELKGPGVDVAWLLPVSWFAELRLAGQMTQPGLDTSLPSRRTAIARMLQYADLAQGATLGLGISGASVEDPDPGASEQLGGADLFLKIHPVRSRSYGVLQGELFLRRLSGTADAGTDVGGYLQAVYRHGPYFLYGLRGESSPAASMPGTERRLSALAGWLPSEFQRIRAQVAWDHLPDGRDGFEGTVQLEFVIGAHGAHPF